MRIMPTGSAHAGSSMRLGRMHGSPLATLRARFRGEDGVAMVLALMISFIVLLLGTTVVAQSISTLEGSGLDRRRTLAVHGAEAGLDELYQYFATTSPANLSTGPFSVAVDTRPQATSVAATVTYVNAAGSTMAPPFTTTSYPAGALVHSVATSGTGVKRTMESYLSLTPRYQGFDQAILSANSASFSNSFTVNGMNGEDADVFVLNGNFSISNSSAVHGTIYAPTGSVTLSGNSKVYGDVWANLGVTTSNPNNVMRDVTSSTGAVSIGGHVYGDARSGATMTGASNVDGSVLQNSPQGPPPSQTFPTIGYNQSSWVAAGYTNFRTFTDCAAARTYVEGTWSGNTVVRIASTCAYNNSNNATVNVNGHLAIITDGAIDLSQKSTWNGITSTRQVFFISTAPAASCTGTKDITVGNSTGFNSLVNVFFYTPCAISMNNANSMTGQVMGGTVTIGNLFVMNYRPVLVPGVAAITGFDEGIAYIREVV
jgi:hypothetical protein